MTFLCYVDCCSWIYCHRSTAAYHTWALGQLQLTIKDKLQDLGLPADALLAALGTHRNLLSGSFLLEAMYGEDWSTPRSEDGSGGLPVGDVDFVGIYSPVDRFLIELLRRCGTTVSNEPTPDTAHVGWLGVPTPKAARYLQESSGQESARDARQDGKGAVRFGMGRTDEQRRVTCWMQEGTGASAVLTTFQLPHEGLRPQYPAGLLPVTFMLIN